MPFEEYAEYYDLMYTEKDYPGESDYVHGLIQDVAPQSKNLLDLGCGTGAHARHFAELGYSVVGVDLSEAQLRKALEKSSVAKGGQPHFIQGDIRALELGRKFDAVVCLFHVINYQTRNADLINAFRSARTHLNDDGVFIFDTWYGPSVLKQRPETRIKRIEKKDVRLTRLAEPEMLTHENRVDVHYELLVEKTSEKGITRIEEIHRMRYLFLPEIKSYLDACGMRLDRFETWMTGAPAGEDSWSCCTVATVKNAHKAD